MKIINYLSLMGILLLFSCQNQSKENVDKILYNANIYTVDEAFSKAEAIAIKDEKIIGIGSTDEILSQYTAAEQKDLKGQTVIPGIFDAHAHFLWLGRSKLQVNLTETKNYDEMLSRIFEFQKDRQTDFIFGHGWDQSDWPENKFPTKQKLDSLFPDTPVALTRIDLHAMLVNQKTLDLAKIDENSSVEGGSFLKENGNLTGVLLDNAMEAVYRIIPEPSYEEMIQALKQVQEDCFAYGITTITDAALSHEEIQLLNQAVLEDQLQINIYPFLMADDPHLEDYLFHDLGKNKGLSCRAIKLFGDGALGSRGAALISPYSDDPENYGKMRVSPEYIDELTQKIADSDFQLNAHAIGDSTNHYLLKAFDKALKNKPDRRWRIEHAQVVQPEDLKYFSENIIPSVQPTHAISDMKWISERLGEKRTKMAYANKDLLNQAGIIALGTDAPVEELSPFRTFYAAVVRKNKKGEPKNGFQPENALNRAESLKGMTIWAAYSQFSEHEKGSLEPGKDADFVILNQDIMQVPEEEILSTKAEATYLKGGRVF